MYNWLSVCRNVSLQIVLLENIKKSNTLTIVFYFHRKNVFYYLIVVECFFLYIVMVLITRQNKLLQS